MILKNYIKRPLATLLMLCMISAVVPMHNILHEHYFIKTDTCGNSCEKHLKNYSKPCCTTSDAVSLSDLPIQTISFTIEQPITNLKSFNCVERCFQFFHLTKNKAPPLYS